jgi:hypothetical protein
MTEKSIEQLVGKLDEPPTERFSALTPPVGRFRRLITSSATIAVITWLVAVPVAMLLPRVAGLDPFVERGAFVPIAAGAVLLVAGCVVAMWWRAGEWVSAVAAGLFAAWVALALQVGLTGTPFGYAGLQSDNGRMTTAAVQYTVHFWSTDTFVEGIPSEYPPLFPWLVGRASLLLGIPAWRLVGPAEVLLLSFAVLAGYLMWRRLVSAPVALVAAATILLAYGVPFKPFTIVALVVTIPWVISTFTDPPRGRLHWLPAGVIGGLIVMTYHGWLTFAAVGILAIIVAGYRKAESRSQYGKHVLLTVLVAFVVASPYVVPYGYALLTSGGGQPLSDLYLTNQITNEGFPFLDADLFGLLQLVGLAGLVLLRQRTFWARPMLYLVLGAYVFWLVLGIRFLMTGHTTLFYYVARFNSAVLAVAGVLALVHVLPLLARRLSVVPPYRAGAAVVAVTLLWVGYTYWQDWRPRPWWDADEINNYSAMSHLEPLPDCTYPQFRPTGMKGIDCLPVDRIEAAVERVRGDDARPHTLSVDERLFSFLPWNAYMGSDRTSAGTLVRFDDRMAELVRLSKISDPDDFAAATQDTAYGPIDVLVLGRVDDDLWAFREAQFRARQFDPAEWEVIDRPDWTVVVAIRR